MIRRERHTLRFGAAVLIVCIVGGTRLALAPVMGADAPLLPFLLAVLAAGFVGGLGPALTATALAPLLVTPIFTAWPNGANTLAWSAHVALFLAIAVTVSFITHRAQLTTRAQQDALFAAQQAERQASASEAQLRLIADAMPALIAYVDRQHHFRFNNRRYEEWFDQSRENMTGRHVRDVIGDSPYADVQPRMDEALSGKFVHFESEVPGLHGGMRQVEAHYIPDIGPDNEIRGYFALVEDITERKRAEQALRAADRRKDEFLAMLAHELRNPLAPIRNIAYMLAKENVDADAARRGGELLRRQVDQLVRLVDDLLDVARITRGAIRLTKESLSIERVLDTALESLQPLISAKRQVVGISRTSLGLRVEGDAVRLSQVFANLLENAAKYSPDGASIHVSVEQSGNQAVVRVRDEGAGIDAERLPYVFELFAQAERPLDRSQGGLGVGLTIVKSLVDMHGGQVEALSAGIGRGSEFIVRLPLLIIDERLPAPIEASAPASTQPRRILVVDDNRDSAESLVMLLSMAGHQVRIAYDGTTALEILERFEAEFVFLDIGLPGIDGYTVATSIRERFPELPRKLYALTGYGREEDRSLALKSGFDGHFTKPVDPDVIFDLLDQNPPEARS